MVSKVEEEKGGRRTEEEEEEGEGEEENEEDRVWAHGWRSGDNLWRSVFSFHPVGFGNQAQAIRLGGKHCCPPSHQTGPQLDISDS